MTIDQEGKLWIAFYNGAKVVRFDPETGVFNEKITTPTSPVHTLTYYICLYFLLKGKELNSVSIPALRTTSCCFGGENVNDLYVTCAAAASEKEWQEYPLSGSLFKVTGLSIKGLPGNNFSA